MSNPAVTNIDGSNPGPNVVSIPDTVQSPIGNVQKLGVFNLTLSPVAVAANTVAEQTFSATGIGLLTTDAVDISKPTTQAGLGIVNCRVSATDTLAVAFVNATAASITPTANEVYTVSVTRVQPNWTPPASGNKMDW